MTDKASNELAELIKRSDAQAKLLIADENTLSALAAIAPCHTLKVISNRYDVAEQLNGQGHNCDFSDFDFNAIDDHSLDQIFYRVSKEKPVVHHVINQSRQKLKHGGELIFCGYKTEGTKSYFSKAKPLFAGPSNLSKNGDSYTATLTQGDKPAGNLDDKSYSSLRACLRIDNAEILSKPGLFGWDKIDKGSKLLVEQLDETLSKHTKTPASMLDLGCGYGYLTLASRHLKLEYRCATDNNAAALLAAHTNLNQDNLCTEIIASDCAKDITHQFDLILCNPPFHQGFSVDGDLTDKFLSNINRLLNNDGLALLVVNQFVPLERKATLHKLHAELILKEAGFKVMKLIKSNQ